MFLNNKNFYPTPIALAAKLIEGLDFNRSTVLEPSAGKGDIARMIKNQSRTATIHLIEIEPELQQIAKQYGTIVDNDFLEFNPDCPYDFIIMNPPFDNGDKHLLHAIEISDDQNTTIRCILNAETIRNPYSQSRKQLVNLLEHHQANIEYIQNGFSDAERTTNVEVAMISITLKKQTTNDYFSNATLDKDSDYFGELNEQSLQTPDRLNNIVQDFKRAQKLYSEGVAQMRKAQEIMKHHTSRRSIPAFDIAKEAYSTNLATQEWSSQVKAGIWDSITEALNIQKYMTERVLKDFQSKLADQKNIAISKKNIEFFVQTILQNSTNILEDSIVQAFDELTRHTTDNRLVPEGWAHNSSYMVNKKFIVGHAVKYDAKYFNKFEKGYEYDFKRLADLDRAMCYLTGTPYDTCKKIIETINDAISIGETKCSSEFFDIVFYKKGSGHFTFKSQKTWVDFNLRATKQKGWLPPSQENKWRQSNNFN